MKRQYNIALAATIADADEYEALAEACPPAPNRYPESQPVHTADYRPVCLVCPLSECAGGWLLRDCPGRIVTKAHLEPGEAIEIFEMVRVWADAHGHGLRVRLETVAELAKEER